MVIRIDDHALVDDLCVHFRRSAFEVEDVGGGMIEVRQPSARSDLHERGAIRNHLALWSVLHPGSEAHELP